MSKRFFDIVIAAIGLVLLTPLFFVVTIIIIVSSPGPVFYRQQRVGRHGNIFYIYKFRTMHVRNEPDSQITIGERDPRITCVGFFLRKYKIDELPQLIDVVRGKMSIVGPRPEVIDYVALYPPELKKIVLSVRPGITDNASIAMIDESELLAKYSDPHEAYIEYFLPIKLKYYVEYVNKQSLSTDFIIILKTIRKIISR